MSFAGRRLWLWLWLGCLVWMGGPGIAWASDSVMCTDLETEKSSPVSITGVRESVTALRARVERGDFHVLDLNSSLQARRRRLMGDLAKGSWCVVRSHVVNLDDEFLGLKVDTEFVAEKFRRVERWYRNGDLRFEDNRKLKRVLGEAAKLMAKDRNEAANRKLNRALSILFGGTRWTLPSSDKFSAFDGNEGAGEDYVEILSYEVEGGCPNLDGKKGKRSLNRVVKELTRTLRERSLRPLDLEDGERLIQDFRGYYSLEAVWPSIRVLCVIRARVSEVEIGLASVVRRFRGINKMFVGANLSASENQEFKLLIREASSKLGDRQFQGAHKILDSALVLLGEPASFNHYFSTDGT